MLQSHVRLFSERLPWCKIFRPIAKGFSSMRSGKIMAVSVLDSGEQSCTWTSWEVQSEVSNHWRWCTFVLYNLNTSCRFLGSSMFWTWKTMHPLQEAPSNLPCNLIPRDSLYQYWICLALQIPSDFLCPISLEMMTRPMILLQSGKTYNFESINRWLSQGKIPFPAFGNPQNHWTIYSWSNLSYASPDY